MRVIIAAVVLFLSTLPARAADAGRDDRAGNHEAIPVTREEAAAFVERFLAQGKAIRSFEAQSTSLIPADGDKPALERRLHWRHDREGQRYRYDSVLIYGDFRHERTAVQTANGFRMLDRTTRNGQTEFKASLSARPRYRSISGIAKDPVTRLWESDLYVEWDPALALPLGPFQPRLTEATAEGDRLSLHFARTDGATANGARETAVFDRLKETLLLHRSRWREPAPDVPNAWLGVEIEFPAYVPVGEAGFPLPSIILERTLRRLNGVEHNEESRNDITWVTLNEPMEKDWFELPFPEGVAVDDFDKEDAPPVPVDEPVVDIF